MTKKNTKAFFLVVYMCGTFSPSVWSSGSEDSDCDSSVHRDASSGRRTQHILYEEGESAASASGGGSNGDTDSLRSGGSYSGQPSPRVLSSQRPESLENPSYERPALFTEEGAEGSGDVEALLAQSEGGGVEEVLEALGVTRDTLEAQDVPYESLERIWEVERRALTSSLRWASVDALVKKGLVWGVIRKRDTLAHAKEPPFLSYGFGIGDHTDIETLPRAIYMDTGEAVGVVNEESRLLRPAEDKAKKRRCCDPVWMSGGSVPLRGEKPYRRMTAWDEAREGIGFVVFRGLHLGIYAFLGYDLVTAIQEGGVNFSMLTNLYRGQDEAMINHILGFLQNPAGPYLASTAVALPFLWGGAKGIWASYQRATLSIAEQEHILHYFQDAPQGKWRDVFRWMLPFHPIDKRVNTLLRHARWDGTLSTQDLTRIQHVFEELALKRYGYTQIVGMHALAKMVYANHLKDYKRLKGEGEPSERFKARVMGELLMKAKGLEILETLAKTQERWRNREGFWDGTDRVWKSVYAKYLLWTLGQNKSWVFGTTMLGWKTLKAVTLSLLFKTFIQALIEYTRCPHVFQNLHHGEIGPVNDRIQCFESYLKAFNTIPGQPISSLTELVPHVNFPNPYDLSLANKGVRGYQVADLLTAIHSYHPDLYLRTLNLTGNPLDQPQDFDTLMPAIGAFHSLEVLDLSNTNMGTQSVNATLVFAHGMPHLSTLRILDLSGNSIEPIEAPYSSAAGVEAIGKGLQFLTNLISLDLSNNGIGLNWMNGTIELAKGIGSLLHLTTLDLSRNNMGLHGTAGIEAIANGLHSLSYLTYLDLSYNTIGEKGTAGTKAIGKNFKYLPDLTSLNLSHNYLGILGTEGIEAIGNNLHHLTQLTSLDLGFNMIVDAGTAGIEAIGHGLQYLSQLTTLDLSANFIGDSGTIGVEVIGHSLQYLSQLTTLDLSASSIEEHGTAGIEAIGHGLQYLSQLTTLDLSMNSLGHGGIAGIEALGNSLRFLFQLTTLDLSENDIGHTGAEGIEVIGKSLHHLSQLTSLNLQDNYLQRYPNGTQALVNDIFHMPHLQTLYFQQVEPMPANQMDQLRQFWKHRGPTDIYQLRTVEDLLAYLQNFPMNTTEINLRGLLISYDHSDSTMLAVMKQLAAFPHLTSLDLSHNNLESAGASKSWQKLFHLTALDLSHNYLGNSGTADVEALGKALHFLPNLTTLNLSNNGLGDIDTAGVEAIGEGLHGLTQLTSLNLSGTQLGLRGTAGVEAISKSLHNLSQLTVLDLSYDTLGIGGTAGMEAVEVLGKALHFLPNLTSLNLSHNYLGNKGTAGVEAIGNGLQYTPNLTYLDLSSNQIGTTGVNGTIALAEGIGSLPHLRYLYLENNNFDTHGLEGVKALFENIPFGQLCAFNIGEVHNIPWTEGQKAVYELNRQPIEESCYAQRCFGRTVAPVIPSPCDNTTQMVKTDSMTSPSPFPSLSSTRTILQYEMLEPLPEEVNASLQERLEIEEEEGEKASSWNQRLRHTMQGVWQGTKDRVNGLTDWVLEKVIKYVDQVTHENESYFPNIDDPTQRYWGETSVVNTTFSRANSTVSVAAAPTARPLN